MTLNFPLLEGFELLNLFFTELTVIQIYEESSPVMGVVSSIFVVLTALNKPKVVKFVDFFAI